MITAAVVGDAEVVAKIGRLPQSIRTQLRQTIEQLAIKLSRRVKQDKLTGQVLNVRTGRLRRSINYRLTEASNSIVATVGTNVEYARIHEYGGRVGKQGIMPERSYLRSSLAEMKAEIKKELATSIRRAAQEVMK